MNEWVKSVLTTMPMMMMKKMSTCMMIIDNANLDDNAAADYDHRDVRS